MIKDLVVVDYVTLVRPFDLIKSEEITQTACEIMKKITDDAIKQGFTVEFLNNIDEIIHKTKKEIICK